MSKIDVIWEVTKRSPFHSYGDLLSQRQQQCLEKRKRKVVNPEMCTEQLIRLKTNKQTK